VEILVFVLAIGLAIGAALWSYQLKQKRRRELTTMARQFGLEYSREDLSGCLSLPFALLRRGDGRGTENVLTGVWQDTPLLEFDYWYYEESTDSNGNRTRSTYRFSCAATEIDAGLSPLTLGRENVLTRLADSIGLSDIQFELEDFNRAFTVKCKDPKFANDFIDQRMMGWLIEADRSFSFEACGRWLLVYSKRRRPTDLIPLIGTLRQYRDHVPRVVYDLYGLPASG
jgi:hypothetical protein